MSELPHDDFIKWKHFPRYWSFMRGIHWSPVVHRWIPLTKASDAEFWCFLRCGPKQTAEQTVEMSVMWDAILLIVTSL